MDALALLCNLHANGPTTMRRMGRAGITRLEQIPGIAVDELAELLNGPPSHARRFIAEAVALARRVGEGLLEPEEPLEMTEAQAPAPVMEVTLPQEAPPLPLPSAMSPPEDDEEEEVLRPGLLEGLDDLLCLKLLGQGVRTLRALSETAGLNLARRIGLPLTQLLDIQYDAQRALRATLHPPVTTAPKIPLLPRTATERAIEQTRTPALTRSVPEGDAPSVSGPFV